MPTRAQPGAESMARTIRMSSIRGMHALEHYGNKIARLSVEIVDMWGVPLQLARPTKIRTGEAASGAQANRFRRYFASSLHF